MIAKISVTTKCNARCETCPVWTYKGQDMEVTDFKHIWDKLNDSEYIQAILINNTGDIYNHEYYALIFDYMRNRPRKKYTVMTTNAGKMYVLPDIDELVISFNGGNKEAYEKTTGLDFNRTCDNIRNLYPWFHRLRNLEMHCLIYEGNADSEKDILSLWGDFPGRIRISYKYDNQMDEDKTLDAYKRSERIPCDYLDMLSIWPDGRVIMCAHDFRGETVFGNILDETIEQLAHNEAREEKKIEHLQGKYLGLCEKCNYNTPIWGKVKYIKG